MEKRTRRTRRATAAPLAAAILLSLGLLQVAAVAAQPAQPPSPAQEGFVPVDRLEQKEELPAAPLVMAAYAVAWLVIFGYVWSLWRRLAKVEQEIVDISKRVPAGGRR